jgi:hypothetical protein
MRNPIDAAQKPLIIQRMLFIDRPLQPFELMSMKAWMHEEAISVFRLREFRGDVWKQLHFWIWIRFGSDVHWDMGPALLPKRW